MLLRHSAAAMGCNGYGLFLTALTHDGNQCFFFCPLAQRHLLARLPRPSHRLHPRLAHAPGRALPARIPRPARTGRQFHGAGKQPAAGGRSHAATAGALPAGCRHSVQRHSDGARCHGAGPVVSAGRRPAVRPPRTARRRCGPSGRARYGAPALCIRCRALRAPRPARPRAAHRLCGQPLDAGLLHGPRRQQHQLPHHQAAALHPTGFAAPHPRHQCRQRRSVPERTNPSRCASRDAV